MDSGLLLHVNFTIVMHPFESQSARKTGRKCRMIRCIVEVEHKTYQLQAMNLELARGFRTISKHPFFFASVFD